MGAKAPEKLKLRRQPCSCDICGRTFLNAQALSSHKKYMHKPKSATAKDKEAKLKKVIKKSPVPAEPKETVQTPTIQVIPKAHLSPRKKGSSSKKIQFKCPRCVKVFSVYFSAYRHIQKYHCVDNKDLPVPPDSQRLIKPVRTELCVFCNQWLELGGNKHTCQGIFDRISELYMCLGCQQTFDNLLLFEHHVKGLHANGAEYFFFPTEDEFRTWKLQLEDTTQIKYVTLTTKQKSKQIYHCSHQPALKTEKTLLCPSSLCVTEFKSGFQVTYYKEHFGHTCSEMPTTNFKKYLINPFLKDADGVNSVDNDDNVYQQFKNIMNCISVNAAKVDIGVLNTLLEKALEMTVLLNSSIPDEQATVAKSMTDEQISDILAEVKTYPGKRKADSIKKDVKRPKPSLENDENTTLDNSLPDIVSNKVVSKKPVESLPVTLMPRPLLQSPSFNDTYKDFVDQNFTLKLNESSTPKKSTVKKKVVMKTKIGQFKVRPSLSPKSTKKSPVKTIEYTIKPDVRYEVKEQENDCNILILKI